MEEKKEYVPTLPLFDASIEYDYSHLPKKLQEKLVELETLGQTTNWFEYDILFDYVEIYAKDFLRDGLISEKDYLIILRKYGWLSDV